MNFSIGVPQIQDVVSALKPIISRGSDEISNRLLIEVADDIVFSASNETTALKINVPGEIKSTGKALTFARQLLLHLSTFSPWNGQSGTKEVAFSIKEGKFFITSDTSYTSGVFSKKALDYRFLDPALSLPIPEPTKEADFSLDAGLVKNSFRDVLWAINVNNSKEGLRGLHISYNADGIFFVSSDGIRLVEFSDTTWKNDKDPIDITLGQQFATTLISVLKTASPVKFYLEKNGVLARVDNILVSGRLIKPKFPMYHGYFNKFDNEFSLSKAEFLDNLAGILPLLNPNDSNRVVMKLVPGKLILAVENFTNECKLNFDHSLEKEIHVDGELFYSCLSKLHGDKLILRWTNRDDGQVEYITIATPDSSSVRALLVTLKY